MQVSQKVKKPVSQDQDVDKPAMASEIEGFIERMRSKLPLVFTRSEIERLTGGVLRKNSLANIEASEGKIPGSFYMRRRRAYQLEPFLKWWAEQITFDN